MRERSSRKLQNSWEVAGVAVRTSPKLAEKMQKSWKWLYKLCTISWLSSSGRPLRIVGLMQQRFSIILIGAILCSAAMTLPLKAEDKVQIQAFVSPSGKVVFTNLVDNTPPPVKPVLPGGDVLEREIPSPLKV